MKKEPALLVLIVAYLIGLVAEAIAPGQYDSEVIEGLAELLLMGGAWLAIRANVFSRQTLLNAGLQPRQVEHDAKDPNVTPVPEIKG